MGGLLTPWFASRGNGEAWKKRPCRLLLSLEDLPGILLVVTNGDGTIVMSATATHLLESLADSP